eukprot:2412742-Rhodomonas_salina.1
MQICLCGGLSTTSATSSFVSRIVMDNVSQHWDVRVEAIIQTRGSQVIYLPRYSPEVCSPSVVLTCACHGAGVELTMCMLM